MDAHNLNLKRKQQSENESEHSSQSNNKRPASSESPTPPTATITDLNDDCLVNIFERLSLQYLFNVAVACNWLIPSASAVYKRKFGKKKVSINYDEVKDSPSTPGPHCDFIGNQIKVHGFTQCCQYLRCFGASISNLSIWCRRWSNVQCHQIYHYVNKYGAENLIKIEFFGKPSNLINGFEKPFVNVQKILFFEIDLSDQFPLLPQWFPNIRTLELFNVRVAKRYIETPFHHLTELRIGINADEFHRFKQNEVADLLLMCRQLQSLYIRVYDLQGMTLNTLLNLIHGNTMLRNLTVAMTQYSMTVIQSEVMRLVQEHPTLIELNLRGYEFTANNAIQVIQQIDSLKNFSFKIDDQSEYDRFKAIMVTDLQAVSCSLSDDSIATMER